MLEDLLSGYGPATPPGPACATVMGGAVLHANLSELRTAIDLLVPGQMVAYAVRLDLPLLTRVLTIATLSPRLRLVERTMERRQVTVVGTFGIDPHLDAPAFVYQLHSPAAAYADHHLRPRGTAVPMRRVVAYCCGYDLSLGAVVVLGRKR